MAFAALSAAFVSFPFVLLLLLYARFNSPSFLCTVFNYRKLHLLPIVYWKRRSYTSELFLKTGKTPENGHRKKFAKKITTDIKTFPPLYAILFLTGTQTHNTRKGRPPCTNGMKQHKK
jgi:hypothetical protein